MVGGGKGKTGKGGRSKISYAGAALAYGTGVGSHSSESSQEPLAPALALAQP